MTVTQDIKLSVIIPVHNAQNYLEKCLRSVLEQDVADMEVIIVDDGSTDGSRDICRDHARRDARIRLIEQANAGVSAARNKALDMARGTYITFVDADDYLYPNTYPVILSIFDDDPSCDLVEFPFFNDFAGRQRIMTYGNKVYTDMSLYWDETRAFAHTYMWNKIFGRHLFDDLRFDGEKVFEDALIYPRILERTKVLRTTELGLYYYRRTPGSLTSNQRPEDIRILFDAHHRAFKKYGGSANYQEMINLQIQLYRLTHEPPILHVYPYRKSCKQLLASCIGIKGVCKLYNCKKNIGQWIRRKTRRNH